MGDFNFAEEGLLFGIYAMIDNSLAEVPPEVGRIAAYSYSAQADGNDWVYPEWKEL